MERTRVIEIIEAYGGYPAAWPEDERVAAERAVMFDASLIAMMNDARAVDRVLRDWACTLVPATDDEADRMAERALDDIRNGGRSAAAPRHWLPRAAFGGALAASLAIGAILLSRPDAISPVAPPAPPAGVQIALGELPGEDVQAAHDMLVLGSVFTPTPEEEMVL